MAGLSRQTESLVGLGALGLMTILLVLAIAEFEGPATFILLVVAGVFLLLGLFFLAGGTHRSAASDTGGSSQQQSVVIGGASGEPVHVTSQSGVLVVCPECQSRVAEGSTYCPQCGAEL